MFLQGRVLQPGVGGWAKIDIVPLYLCHSVWSRLKQFCLFEANKGLMDAENQSPKGAGLLGLQILARAVLSHLNKMPRV